MNFKKIFLASAFAAIMASQLQAQTAPQLSKDNIDEVVAAMTLEEKARLLVGGGNEGFAAQGAGMGAQKKIVAGAAGITVAIPRLGIPSTVLTDGPAGVHIDATREGTDHTYYATGFPVGAALAATWNTDLVEEVGKSIGNEVLEYGCDVILGPGLNLQRNPLCGRNFEYYSEDPILSGKIAAAYVRGVQSQGVGTSPKHFAVNTQESDRTRVDEQVSQRALRELYLRNFEIMVREGNPWTVMASYNKINGTFAQYSRDLLTTILRDEWGFQGYVMTDWIGLRDTKAQVTAGNDLMMPGAQTQLDEIVDGVNSGRLDIKYVDECVRNILKIIVRTPRFNNYKYSDAPDLKAHAAVTRSSSTEGMVLLKNEGQVLPLKQGTKKVALFGVNSYDFFSGGMGSGCVHTPYVVDMVAGLKSAGISTTEALTGIYQTYVAYAANKFKADHDPIMWFLDQGQPKFDEIEITERCAKAACDEADAAIITIGRQAGEGIDRAIEGEFNLTHNEKDMITRVSQLFRMAGKPVIVVINSGTVVETQSWKGLADAILMAWQPGEEGGNSVADVLTGKANPSGKLAQSWPISIGDDPSTRNFPQEMSLYDYKERSNWGAPIEGTDFTKHEEDIYVGYRYYDTFQREVSFPFGFGLSYTTFQYGKPVVKQKGETIEVSVPVKNTGSVAGKEVVQLYVSAPACKVERPAKELKAFGKTRELQPGETQTLKLTLQRRDLSWFDEEGSQWVVTPGKYTFQAAASVSDVRATATANVGAYTEKVSDVLRQQAQLNLLRQTTK